MKREGSKGFLVENIQDQMSFIRSDVEYIFLHVSVVS